MCDRSLINEQRSYFIDVPEKREDNVESIDISCQKAKDEIENIKACMEEGLRKLEALKGSINKKDINSFAKFCSHYAVDVRELLY